MNSKAWNLLPIAGFLIVLAVSLGFAFAQVQQFPPPIDDEEGPIITGEGTRLPKDLDEKPDTIYQKFAINGTFYDDITTLNGTLEVPIPPKPQFHMLYPCITIWKFTDGTEELRVFWVMQYPSEGGATVCSGLDWKHKWFLKIVTQDDGSIKWELYPVAPIEPVPEPK